MKPEKVEIWECPDCGMEVDRCELCDRKYKEGETWACSDYEHYCPLCAMELDMRVD